jgi:hypothetical protein
MTLYRRVSVMRWGMSNDALSFAVFVRNVRNSHTHQLKTINNLTAKSCSAGVKLVLFGRYVLNFYRGIVLWILHETNTWCATIYLATQHTNWWILTSPKKIQFWPSTDVIDAASLVQIASNSSQDEVIMRSTCYQTLWTDKNLARNYSTKKLVKKLALMSANSC